MMNLLLISNDGGLVKKERGSSIDSFDGKIARFNLFELKGIEKQIGSRVDYICARACDDIPKRPADSFEHMFMFIPHCPLSVAMRNVSKQYLNFYGEEKLNVIDTNINYPLARKLKLPSNKRPSVGMMAVDYFVSKGYNITLLGFKYEGKITHYFKQQPKDPQNHDWVKEQNYLNSLREKNIITDWSD